eukprot:TRINITY_DN13673_c0_g1_i2.p1 TRINITY_DN13673_c0_g1~~TRINITY_DN13673_c0_g1_i2.p1  ORF type:complete len:315 (-),score=53.79 TRINITY_DN13673_c0_g1_i2:153-1097(-)
MPRVSDKHQRRGSGRRLLVGICGLLLLSAIHRCPGGGSGASTKRDLSVGSTEDASCDDDPHILSEADSHAQDQTVSGATCMALLRDPAREPSSSSSALPPLAPWTGEADIQSIPGLDSIGALGSLLQVKIIRHKPQEEPWRDRERWEPLYFEMGMREAHRQYVSFWLNIGPMSILSVAQVNPGEGEAKLAECIARGEDCMRERLKLILWPVQTGGVRLPTKAPADADFVKNFFGKSASFSMARSSSGVEHVNFQVDLYFAWWMKAAMQNIGLRLGAVVDTVLVDWPGQVVVANLRLNVTPDLYHFMYSSEKTCH